jgi:2-polyprenyl-3-methyl-5-hydroxy-6-metoxy-1,4-benzoquinol methylase
MTVINRSRQATLAWTFSTGGTGMNQPLEAKVSREELTNILHRERFRYQRMPLPYGLSTEGHDRSSTAKLIFDADLEGASVLDIGCCYGFFCYEAKRRNAGRVVGVELDPDRYRQAMILHNVLGSDIELRNQDFQEVVRKENFDFVLFLNVIHHLDDPIQALRQIGACVQRRLVMEFPTFSDRKFRRRNRSMLGAIPWLLNRLPLIGVGATQKAPKFVFSPKAIERLFSTPEQTFRSIRFMRSPFVKERIIAICDK